MEQVRSVMDQLVAEAGQVVAGAGVDAEMAAEKIIALSIIGLAIPIVADGITATRMMCRC
jgi:hypothetical protein